MKLTNNKLVVGSLVLIAVSVAYYLLIYLPKQQELRVRQEEISLRKQVYELCLKEYVQMENSLGDFLAQQRLQGQITQQEMGEKSLLLQSKKDEFLTNCVEKRLQGYKEPPTPTK